MPPLSAEELRKTLFGNLNKTFQQRGLNLSQIARDANTPHPIDKSTGSWANAGLFAKTPRFIIQLKDNNGSLEAGQFYRNPTLGRLGYFNSANQSSPKSAVLVRVLSVFQVRPYQFIAIEPWEWLLLLVFDQLLVGGSSSDTLDNFFPPKTTVNWNGLGNAKPIGISYASLFGLLPPATSYSNARAGISNAITYQEASNAIRSYLTFE